MPKRSKDYDDIFKTLKIRHTRLFISIINKAFNKNYPLDAEINFLSSEGQLILEDLDGSADIEGKENDSYISINGDKYIIECQSYDDDTIALRLAEYIFIVGSRNADIRNGKATIILPKYSIIYVKGDNVPEYTEITFKFADDDENSITYKNKNIILKDIEKEHIISEKLYALIPFYITRYEKELIAGDADNAIADLLYFSNELENLFNGNEITANEYTNIYEFILTIIKHITNGSNIEERLVSVMGGKVLETASDRIEKKTKNEIFSILRDIQKGYDTVDELVSQGHDKQVVLETLEIYKNSSDNQS